MALRLLRSRGDRFLIVALVVLVVAAVAQQVYINTRPEPVRVFDYPQQRVDSRLPGVNGPATKIDGSIVVVGTKCNIKGVDVKMRGAITWVSMDPPGTLIAGGQGSNIRPATPRCVTREYTNPIPPQVQEATRQLLAATPGLECVRWQMTGLETPDNRMFLPESWTTQEFALCP